MSDILTTLAIVAVAVTGVSVVLARLIPDEYDRMKPELAKARQPPRRR